MSVVLDIVIVMFAGVSMRSRKYACALFLFTLFVSPKLGYAQFAISATPGSKAQTPKTDHAERSLAAIDLAIIAAESGILDVSLEAMKRAVAKGPPVKSVDLGGLLSSGPRTRVRSSRNNPAEQEAATAQMRLAKRLKRLHDAWSESNLDPQLAYASWKELVLPSGRPNEAFAYSVDGPLSTSYSYSNVPFEFEKPKISECGAWALVEWARKAKKVDDLDAELTTREKLPGAQSTVLLLNVILAQDESTPVAKLESICRQLSTKTKLLVDDPNAKLLMSHVWKMLERLEEDSAPRKELMGSILDATKSNQDWPANDWLQYLVTKRLRDAVDNGDKEEFVQAFNLAVSRYDKIRPNNVDYVASMEASAYSQAASRAFEAGHVELGIDCLRLQSKIAASSRYGSNSANQLLNTNSAVGKHLLKMDAKQRRLLLNDLVWNLPMLGLRQSAKMKPTESVPAVFTAKLPKGDLPTQQMASKEAVSMSLLEWAMRDALANGKEDEILKRIKDKESEGSDDAKLAELVLQLAKNEPLDLGVLIKGDAAGEEDEETKEGANKNAKPQIQQVLGNGEYVLPLDLDVTRLALKNENYHKLGQEHLDRMLELCANKHYERQLTWLRRMKHEDAVSSGKPVPTQDALKHWLVSDDVGERDYQGGNVPHSVWLKRDGDGWGHEYGTHVSYLLFRYPFEGDCTITLRSKDGLYEEGGVMLSGLVTEFFSHSNDLRTWGIGNRGYHDADTDTIKAGEFNDYKFVRKGDKLTITVGDDEFEKEIDLVSGAFPFFGMNSYGYRATTFDSLKIDGDVTIPRSVELLSPSLLGWSTKYKQQRLRNVKHIAEMDVPSDPKKTDHDWQFADGIFESVDHSTEETEKEKEEAKRKKQKKRTEALIQYLRPLADGEEISFEFYHEAGKYSLAPAVGRIAMDLSNPASIGLHWITADTSGSWTGIGSDNLVVDEHAEQMAAVKLRENEWNAVAVRFEGGQLTLKLNGMDVYRRAWERVAGRKFGLFHDPTKYLVRVRNMTLRGDWPEKLPNDLFELSTATEKVAEAVLSTANTR